MSNDGGPAFPRVCPATERYDAFDTAGMTLRDYLAAKAMAAWMSTYGPDVDHPASQEGNYLQWLATYSYATADAMLAERAKGPK